MSRVTVANNSRPSEAVVQVLATLGANGKRSALTLELLGDASALARRWSGRVGAWVLTAPSTPVLAFDELAAHGCHLVWHLRNDRLARWSSEAIVEALGQWLSTDCRLVLLPGDARGEEVAALLAERLETDWIADALTLAVNRAHVLEITAVLPGGKLSRTFRATGNRPIVVTMRPGVPEARKVDNPPPLEVRGIDVDLSAVPELTIVERFLPADPRTVDLVFAQRIVSAGRGTGGVAVHSLLSTFRRIAAVFFRKLAQLRGERLATLPAWTPSSN